MLKTSLLSQAYHTARLLGLSAFLLGGAWADEPFLKVKDAEGRELEIQVQKVEDGNVTFKTKQGKEFTLFISKFSNEDREILRNWKPRLKSSVAEDSEIAMVSQGANESVFRSKHFEYSFNAMVEGDAVRKITPLFEVVYSGFSSLPVDLTPQPTENFFKVNIIANTADFSIIAGQSLNEGQPGFYDLGKDTFLIPQANLKASNRLTYELAFCLMGSRLETLPPWFSVGVADYLSAAPITRDGLVFANVTDNLTRHLKVMYGIEGAAEILDPNVILSSSFSDFRERSAESRMRYRSSAFLLFHFLAHIDGKGKGQILGDFFRAVRTSADADTIRETLLAGRTPEKFRDDIKLGFLAKAKLRVTFGS